MEGREHVRVGMPDVRMCMCTGMCTCMRDQMAVLTTGAIATHDR